MPTADDPEEWIFDEEEHPIDEETDLDCPHNTTLKGREDQNSYAMEAIIDSQTARSKYQLSLTSQENQELMETKGSAGLDSYGQWVFSCQVLFGRRL